ncbi:MAG: methyltransferase domain-containing protein [Bryobacterales bacterium]|nr:methyltransferase domain-containing protein [Bryobacterales bacterium]
MGNDATIRDLHRRRTASSWHARLQRALIPPDPYILNPDELRIDAPLGRWNLYIGGAGTRPDGYVNLDLFPLPGVDVAADAEHLPFRDGLFQRIECDAVLEHVERPESILREMSRTLKPGGFLHVVVPFAHPFHEYPRDYRRFTIDGLKLMNPDLEVVKSGWRTGPTATLLVFVLEYAKLWVPDGFRPLVHGILGWVLFPLRYLDLPLFKSERIRRIGNHCYLWLRKPSSDPLLK